MTFPQVPAGCQCLWEGIGTRVIKLVLSLKSFTAPVTGELVIWSAEAVLFNWIQHFLFFYYYFFWTQRFLISLFLKSKILWLSNLWSVYVQFSPSLIHAFINIFLFVGATQLWMALCIQHLLFQDPPSAPSFLHQSNIHSQAPHQILGQMTNDDSRKEREGHSRNFTLIALGSPASVPICCSIHSLKTEKLP